MVSVKIQKETKRKQRLPIGLGATKPTDHTRACMVSRLAEIMAEVMCCMSTTQSPGSSLPETRVAAHGKQAAPLLARFLLTAQRAGRPANSLSPGPAQGVWRANASKAK